MAQQFDFIIDGQKVGVLVGVPEMFGFEGIVLTPDIQLTPKLIEGMKALQKDVILLKKVDVFRQYVNDYQAYGAYFWDHCNAEELISDVEFVIERYSNGDYCFDEGTMIDLMLPVFQLQEILSRKLEDEKLQQQMKARKKRKSKGYVYLLQSPTGAYKIGRTKNPDDRIKTFGVKLPFEVEYIAVIETDNMCGLEASLHEQFEDKRVNGEWFELSHEDIEYIKGLQ